jgi:DNA invertase Pin-like site-specific DNA recombinase
VTTRRTTRRAAPNGETIVIGYCRVSTTEQGDSGLGIGAQRAAIRAECERRGWRLQKVATDVASGKTTRRRPALTQALETLDKGTANVLVIAKLDRLARSVLDFATLMQRAERHGWAVVALDANVDTTSPQGALMVNVLAAFSEFERELIAQRTREALAVKRAQGARLGRAVSLPQDVRERIGREAEEGRTLRAIAAGLEADGVPTVRPGARWHASTIRAVLASLDLDTVMAGITTA